MFGKELLPFVGIVVLSSVGTYLVMQVIDKFTTIRQLKAQLKKSGEKASHE